MRCPSAARVAEEKRARQYILSVRLECDSNAMDCGASTVGLDVFLAMMLALSATAFSWQYDRNRVQRAPVLKKSEGVF